MKKIQHGGPRPGAGRPEGTAKKEPSKVMRIPESKIRLVLKVIQNKLK